jgi:hypothetical protein
MNISYNDGTNLVKPYDEKEFSEALADPRVVKASVYKVGEIVKMSDRSYRVGQSGNLIRIRP